MNTIPKGCLPFDLEKYKSGHPARTRDGKGAKFVAHSPKHPDTYCRVMSVLSDGCWNSTSDLGDYLFPGGVADVDLFLVAPEPKWVPWTPVDEIPDGAWFRGKETKRVYRLVGLDPLTLPNLHQVCLGAVGWVTFEELFASYEWHPDRRHKGPWNVCGKEDVK